MQTSDWIASFALIIASGSLALEVRRWFEGGPKLHLSVMADAKTFPEDDGKEKLMLSVTNRGDTPTTLTHMVGFVFPSIWHRWRDQPSLAGIVGLGGFSISQSLPFELGINQCWRGVMSYEENTRKARTKRQLYVGVYASHSNRNFLIRVPPPSTNIPEHSINSED